MFSCVCLFQSLVISYQIGCNLRRSSGSVSNIGLFDGEPLNNNILLIRTERGCHDRCANPRADLTGHFAFLWLVQMYKITNKFYLHVTKLVNWLKRKIYEEERHWFWHAAWVGESGAGLQPQPCWWWSSCNNFAKWFANYFIRQHYSVRGSLPWRGNRNMTIWRGLKVNAAVKNKLPLCMPLQQES